MEAKFKKGAPQIYYILRTSRWAAECFDYVSSGDTGVFESIPLI